LDTPWGTPPRMEDLDRALTLHPEIEVVALVHHETTTGLLNPLKEVHALCQQHDKRLLLDAVSSLGGEDLDFRETPVDFAAGTANKCLQGYPGVAFVLLKKSHLTRLAALPRRSVYFSLYDNWQAQEAGETLFTPAVQVHYALDQALDELLEETVAGRVRRYRDAARRLREGFRRMGLECLIPEERRSNTLTALRLPPGMTYPWLHDHLRGHGFVIYAGQGPLRQDIFRIANMGDIRPGEFDRLLDVLEKCRTRAGNP
ncbi:MAG: pyridoxal-phosphate-dependent aminotransferase family protein, partial [Nitrospinaceae bacterium]